MAKASLRKGQISKHRKVSLQKRASSINNIVVNFVIKGVFDYSIRNEPRNSNRIRIYNMIVKKNEMEAHSLDRGGTLPKPFLGLAKSDIQSWFYPNLSVRKYLSA